MQDVTAKLVGKEALGLQFSPLDPVEVVCHGDFAPYNCVFGSQGNIKGVIDFDGARLGRGSGIWRMRFIGLCLLWTLGTRTIGTLLYVLSSTSVLGAIFLTGYLGGAIATHVRVGNP